MLGEILELCVLMLSSGLGVLLNMLFCATAHLVNVELGDCFKEVAFVLMVEESGDKNARAPENGDLLSDADDKQLSELDMISSASTSFSSFIFLPSPFPWPLSFSFPSPIFCSTFLASLEMSPISVFSWSQIMEASMLLLCSDPGDDEGLNDSQPGPGADLIGEVHFPALHPNNGFWLPLLPLDPADCPYRGSAGEDKVALKVEIFDFGFSNRFSPGFSTVSDDFFKGAFSNKSSLLRWETLPKGVAPCNVLLEDDSSEENFCKSTLLSTSLLLSSLASFPDKRS